MASSAFFVAADDAFFLMQKSSGFSILRDKLGNRGRESFIQNLQGQRLMGIYLECYHGAFLELGLHGLLRYYSD